MIPGGPQRGTPCWLHSCRFVACLLRLWWGGACCACGSSQQSEGITRCCRLASIRWLLCLHERLHSSKSSKSPSALQESEQQAEVGDDDSKLPFNLVHGKPFTRRHSTFQASAGWAASCMWQAQLQDMQSVSPAVAVVGRLCGQCSTPTPPCCRASLLSVKVPV